ncbi:polysugar degrading enzyme, partial [Bacillus cereus]
MGNSTIWIIVISMIIGGYFLEKFLRKKLNMPKGNVWIYKHINGLH